MINHFLKIRPRLVRARLPEITFKSTTCTGREELQKYLPS